MYEVYLQKAHCDEYSNDKEYDEWDESHESDYLNNIYDRQTYNHNDRYCGYFTYHLP